jgi:hypothetical protein
LTGEKCFLHFRQLGQQPLLAVGWRGSFHGPLGSKLLLGRASGSDRSRLRRKVRIVLDLHLQFSGIGSQ